MSNTCLADVPDQVVSLQWYLRSIKIETGSFTDQQTKCCWVFSFLNEKHNNAIFLIIQILFFWDSKNNQEAATLISEQSKEILNNSFDNFYQVLHWPGFLSEERLRLIFTLG